jgi:hypothetical protein
MSKRSLEQYRVFPYIAWGLVILFAGFVYSLVLNLKAETAELGASAGRLEEKTRQDARFIDLPN